MIYFDNTTDFYLAGPTALTLGKFDGVHCGHLKLMERINAQRRTDRAVISAVFSIYPGHEPRILTQKEQKRVIEQLGVDAFIACPFIPAISQMHPQQFVEEVLLAKLHACYVAVGTDFRFGRGREGDADFLARNAQRFGLQVDVIEKETFRGREISSTYVREALQKGDVELAYMLMGRSYSLTGTTVHGRHLGTKLGMPTANIVPEQDKLLPAYGVYVSETEMDGRLYQGVTNVGVKPTVDGHYPVAETYLFDVEQGRELYGRQMTVRLLHHVRDEVKFETLEDLRQQIRKDIAAGRAWFDGSMKR